MRFVLAVIAALASSIFAIPADMTGATYCPTTCYTDADCKNCYDMPCDPIWSICGLTGLQPVKRLVKWICDFGKVRVNVLGVNWVTNFSLLSLRTWFL
ncbi:hypothetical protein F4604DRAFT_1192623 [Suillus subluteus]|nr:hypothetical protein F4604DRAFT_1192623 [Suillus subluteus]